MAKLYEDVINRGYTNKESNDKILDAYEKVLKEQYGEKEKKEKKEKEDK